MPGRAGQMMRLHRGLASAFCSLWTMERRQEARGSKWQARTDKTVAAHTGVLCKNFSTARKGNVKLFPAELMCIGVPYSWFWPGTLFWLDCNGICCNSCMLDIIFNHKAGQHQVGLVRRSFWGHDGFCPCNTGGRETTWYTNLCSTCYAL